VAHDGRGRGARRAAQEASLPRAARHPAEDSGTLILPLIGCGPFAAVWSSRARHWGPGPAPRVAPSGDLSVAVGAARPDPVVPPWARSPRPVTRPHPPPRPRRGSVHRGRACAAPAAAGRAVRPRHARTAPLLTTREGDERDVAEVERLGPEAPRLEAVQGRAVATSAGVGGPVVLGSRVLVGMPHRETLARPCRSARAPGAGDARRRAGVL